MLEVLLIMSLIYTITLMPLRGKTFETLSVLQLKTLQKNYSRYMKTRKGRNNPNMTVKEYLPILQKQALTFLIVFLCLLPIYILLIIFLYPTLLQ